MHASRKAVDRVLDPTDGDASIESLQHAAANVGARGRTAPI